MSSAMADFGELKTLNPRVAWPNEARDFTPWLAANITKLGDALDMQFEVTAIEADVFKRVFGPRVVELRAMSAGNVL